MYDIKVSDDKKDLLPTCHKEELKYLVDRMNYYNDQEVKYELCSSYTSIQYDMMPYIQAKKVILRELAENMGLIQVVCFNAKRLLRDPMSKLKQSEPRLWLELQLMAA
jgi:hypothetical protein